MTFTYVLVLICNLHCTSLLLIFIKCMICSIMHLLLFYQYVNELFVSYSHDLFRNGSFLTLLITSNNAINNPSYTVNSELSTAFYACYLFSIFQIFELTRLSVLLFLIINCQLFIVNCFVENIGVEPMTSCLQSRRSSQLS